MTDYHLTPAEQTKIEKIVPLHQAKIHLAFRADIVVNNKKFKDGAVALSEHLIVICKRSTIGKSLSLVLQIHLLDIINFSTSSESQCKIVTESDSVQIQSKAVLRFARVLVRNYYVITTTFPPGMRFQFRPHDPNLFPPFHPRMSPSQMFQFSYNANCSYYNTSYVHDVTRFFHRMITEGNGIANLNHLPLSELEVNLGDPIQLRPVFAAFMFCPIIFGVTIEHVARPDIAISLAPLIVANSDVKLISFKDCRVESGIAQIAKAIEKNPNNNITFWDISDNRMTDTAAFCAALARTSADVFYLNVSNTGMTPETTKILFKAIAANRHLWGIKYLNLSQCEFNQLDIDLFCKHLNRLSIANKHALRSLELSGIGFQPSDILVSLVKFPQPIENLDISNISLKSKTYNDLLKFIKSSKTLKKLNLGYTSIKQEMVDGIIKVINANSNIKSINLDLSGNNLGGKKLPEFINSFQKVDLKKWEGISLDNNNLTSSNFSILIHLFKRMDHLKRISLSENFNQKTKDIQNLLIQLFSITSLEEIVIRGTADKGLGTALYPFIDKLKSNNKIKILDISFNHIGDQGLNKVSDLLLTNQTLNQIEINGSFPKDQLSLIKFFDTLAANKNIIHCGSPSDDIYNYLSSVPSRDKASIYELFSSKQLKSQCAMQQNQSNQGMHSDLTLLKIPELDKLLDDVTMEVHNRIQGLKINEHSGIAEAFGLPMPHLDEREDQTKGSVSINDNSDVNNEYDIQSANQMVIESNKNNGLNSSDEGFNTLMYNSLCIRRSNGNNNQSNKRNNTNAMNNQNPPGKIKQKLDDYNSDNDESTNEAINNVYNDNSNDDNSDNSKDESNDDQKSGGISILQPPTAFEDDDSI